MAARRHLHGPAWQHMARHTIPGTCVSSMTTLGVVALHLDGRILTEEMMGRTQEGFPQLKKYLVGASRAIYLHIETTIHASLPNLREDKSNISCSLWRQHWTKSSKQSQGYSRACHGTRPPTVHPNNLHSRRSTCGTISVGGHSPLTLYDPLWSLRGSAQRDAVPKVTGR
jgi:hypothetical protein